MGAVILGGREVRSLRPPKEWCRLRSRLFEQLIGQSGDSLSPGVAGLSRWERKEWRPGMEESAENKLQLKYKHF